MEAHKKGLFKDEIVPVEISGGRGKPNTIVNIDEEASKVIFILFSIYLFIFI